MRPLVVRRHQPALSELLGSYGDVAELVYATELGESVFSQPSEVISWFESRRPL